MEARRTEVALCIAGGTYTFMRDPQEVPVEPAVRVFVMEDCDRVGPWLKVGKYAITAPIADERVRVRDGLLIILRKALRGRVESADHMSLV